MIKVCHMTSAHGAEDVRIFHKECVSLAAAGYDVYLVERGETYDKNGVHIVGVGEIPSGRLKRMTQGAKKIYLKALELDCDIYHFHDPELLPYGLKLKKKGKKVIFDSHENTADAILEKRYLPAASRKLIHFLYQFYQDHICRSLNAIVTVTPSMTRDFVKIHPKVVEIRNYPLLDDNICKPTFAEKRLVFAGGISEQWNHLMLLRAMEEIPESKYCLCGVSASQSYMHQLEEMPAWKQTEFLGKIPHHEVAARMSESYIGVALLAPGLNTDGKNGSMGNTKIFEEMMAGLPVICTDFVLWKEFVDRFKCGICVDPSDVNAIKRAIQYLFDHPEEAKEMGERGHKAVIQEFNWAVEERALVALYQSL